MKTGQILDMIGEAPDYYVKDAADYTKTRRIPRWSRWMVSIAAMLIVALLARNLLEIPVTVSANEVSKASESRKMERPENVNDSEQMGEWIRQSEARMAVVETAVPSIADFAVLVSDDVLSGVDEKNRIWSPVNAYIALSMLADLTESETQAQLLDVLGVSDTEELRSFISAVWEQIYEDNGKEISVLANSLWLDRDVEYVQEKMDAIARDYYASVYQGDLGSEKTNQAITNWMRNQTGGLLKDRTQRCRLDPEDQVLTIASTIYFQSQWKEKFKMSDNTQGTFHAVTGDKRTTFMNKKEYHTSYWWGEDYGAVEMNLENHSVMWFILPDEGKTIDDVLAGNEYMDMVTLRTLNSEKEIGHKDMKVNLSIPRFDVSASMDLKEPLRSAGVTKVFDLFGNDFSPSITRTNSSGDQVFLESINQDTRVKIDEQGVAAASYIELNIGAGAAMPPDEVIDFVLDRPFLFVITRNQIPLFLGTVNAP